MCHQLRSLLGNCQIYKPVMNIKLRSLWTSWWPYRLDRHMSMSWDQFLEFFFTSSHISGTVATDYSLFFTVAVGHQRMESRTASGGRLPILLLVMVMIIRGWKGALRVEEGRQQLVSRKTFDTTSPNGPTPDTNVLNFSWLFERGYQVVKVGSLEVFKERLLAGRGLAQH